MPKVCDHTSVGMLVWKKDSLLLIERRKFPIGFAPPAGHVDEHGSFEDAARTELQEEVGLQTTGLQLIHEKRVDNPCRREDGSWHHWKIYRAETTGELQRSEEETKQVRWVSPDELRALADRIQAYLAKEVSEEEWTTSPGLEPVWYEFFIELKIL